MKVRTGHAIQWGAILVLVAAALISASCAQGPGIPTAPSASVASPALSTQALEGGQSGDYRGRSGS
jgi:hypothetical protein